MRVAFFGEPDSTFSRLHLAQLVQHTNVVLCVAGKKKTSEVPRQPFVSRQDWWERLWVRGRFELRVLRAFGKPFHWLVNSQSPVYFAARNDPELMEIVTQAAPEIIVSAGYRFILPDAILQLPRLGSFNCHPSLLPHYAGSNPWFWILRNGEPISGVTIHRMATQVDAGDIVAQQEFRLMPDMNHQALYNYSSIVSALLLKSVIRDLQGVTLRSYSQDLADYQVFPSPCDGDYRIDWNSTAVEIKNLIRAALPAPGAWTTIEERRFTVRRATVLSPRDPVVGKIWGIESSGFIVGARDGGLCIHAIEFEGKEYNAKDAIRKLGLTVGARLG